MMKKRLILALAAGLSIFSTALRAEGPVVVELFTSQGCSSCPPADALLAEVAGRSDVIALALHVDYWDYIGWKDEFASPEFTKRQKQYAYAAGSRSIYTPQMIVGGKDHVVGYKPMKLAELMTAHKAKANPVDLDISRSGDRVTIKASAGRAVGDTVIRLAVVSDSQSVAIKRGENAGRTIEYHNIVRDMSDLAAWNGRSTFSQTYRVPNGDRIVVLVQQKGMGPILAAASIR